MARSEFDPGSGVGGTDSPSTQQFSLDRPRDSSWAPVVLLIINDQYPMANTKTKVNKVGLLICIGY